MQEYKLIIAGSRNFDNEELLNSTMQQVLLESPGHEISIVSGMAKGADRLGALWAEAHGHRLYLFPADWDQHGKRAGFIRNAEMGRFADGLLAFWDQSSKGTRHMIELMTKAGKPTTVIGFNTGEND